MKHKYLFVALLLLTVAGLCIGVAGIYGKPEMEQKGEELLVVTSFYPMYVATLNVVGDCEGVQVENLSDPQTGCLHDYQLTPGDMMLLSRADVFVVNGGGMEGFLTEVAGEYPNLTVLDAGEAVLDTDASHEEQGESSSAAGVEESGHAGHGDADASVENGSHNHGENAHFWMSVSHYKEQVSAICDGISARNPSNKEEFERNTAEYLAQIEELQQEAEELSSKTQGKPIVILHEAFAFLAEDYGMEVVGELNLDEERQVSAGELAGILQVIKEKKVEIVLAEELYGKALGDTLEQETGCRVYYPDTLVRGDGTADSWLAGMRKNIGILREALR